MKAPAAGRPRPSDTSCLSVRPSAAAAGSKTPLPGARANRATHGRKLASAQRGSASTYGCLLALMIGTTGVSRAGLS